MQGVTDQFTSGASTDDTHRVRAVGDEMLTATTPVEAGIVPYSIRPALPWCGEGSRNLPST